MTTRRWTTGALAALTLSLIAPAGLAEPGPDAFRGAACTDCHSVRSAGIALADDGELASDLSGVGKKHDKRWFAGFLLQQQKGDGGELHKKKFRGEKEALKAIATWLETLK